MSIERPDLDQVPPQVVEYILALEAELHLLRRRSWVPDRQSGESRFDPAEPETTIHVVTVSAGSMAKRTPRHLYGRQRRGGMGIFDLDTGPDDSPAFLAIADVGENLIVLSDQARAFRMPMRQLPQTEPRARGESLASLLGFRPAEKVAVVLPARDEAFFVLVDRRGQVKRMGGHYFGPNLKPGTLLYDVREGGSPAAACWSAGRDDLFIATRQGQAIRFAERLVPVRGCLGMRVAPGDEVIGVASVAEDGAVLLVGDDGKGTIRLMRGFTANKAPGSGGKVAMKSDCLVGAAAVDAGPETPDDVFIVSRLGKIIRFGADEIPPKDGVVQGVNCMNLRGDHCRALAISPAPRPA